MLPKWINKIFFGSPAVDDATSNAGKPEVTKRPDGLLDVFHEAVRGEAAELAELVESGLPGLKRKRKREKLRKKVRQAINPAFDDTTVIEEITDRIAEVADIDPYYARMFGDEE